MSRLSGILERVRANLKHIVTFYHEEVSRIVVWWLWNIPFQVFQVVFSLLLYKYFGTVFGGSSPYYGGDFMAFIISGLMVNTYLDSSLEVYYTSTGALYMGRMGMGGLHLSRRDYLRLAGVSPYSFIFARVTWRYLMETLMFLLYLLIGLIFFDLKVSAQVDMSLVFSTIVLGIAACSGLGLISASMYWLASSYRGIEPLTWFIRIIVPLTAGIYVPREVLPRELGFIGDLLPQTYTVDTVRKVLLNGASLSDVANNLTRLVIQAAVLIPIGITLLKYSLSLERKRGTIY